MSAKIIKELFDRKLVETNEAIIFVDGLDKAMFGVCPTIPKRIVYDYWVSIDILIKDYNMTFDEAEDTVNQFIDNNNQSEHSDKLPIFVKSLNPKFSI